jgi:plastocyanin
MLGRTKTAVLAAGMALAMISPVAAQAADKSVILGPSPKDEKALTKLGADANDFFPHTVTIHVGDSVKFVPSQFHSADFPAKGGKPTPLLSPAGTISAENDAAGNPFWFNGQPQFGFTPVLGQSMFGKKAKYDGSKRVATGLPLGPKPKPMTIAFPKAGSFTYYCNIHPGMKGVVKVVAAKAKVPTAKDDAITVKKAIAADLKLAKKAASAQPAANTVDMGSAAGVVEFFGFLPASKTVPKGTTLTFSMSPGSVEVHTATFGPGDPQKDPSSYIGKLAATFQGPGPFPGAATYPSDQPGAPVSFTSNSHGNGFWNTGVLDSVSATPLPQSNQVRFDEAGTFTYWCLIHSFMKGTVTVTG